MTGDRGRRWANVPVPEPHVAGLLGGLALHHLRPWPLPLDGPAVAGAGVVLVAAGAGLAAWAVRAAGRARLADAATLVTTGPYRLVRHPMYVGWTLAYVGVALAAGLAWPLALLPAVAAWTHVVVRREERRLEARFGEAYRSYAREVRRYR